jgi:hypothetical protein
MQVDIWDELLIRTPVFQRAWIFQERFLATRILQFGKSQIFWECRTENCCETYPNGFPQSPKTDTSYLLKCNYEALQSQTLSPTVRHSLSRGIAITNWPTVTQMQVIWEALVTEYTRCNLTVSSDKLVAFSGIAKDFRTTWAGRINGQTRYIAELWNVHLRQALLWRTAGAGARPSEYRAPTWSWASVNGLIDWEPKFWMHPYTCCTTILDIHVEYVGKEWGQVKAGYIKVKGPLRRLKWSELRRRQVYVKPEPAVLCTGREISEHGVEFMPDERDDKRTDIWGDSLFGLLITRFDNLLTEGRCVIILNVVPGLEDTYQRVGIVRSMSGSDVADWFKEASEPIITIVCVY